MGRPKNIKDEILELRDQGKSYNEIGEILGCSKANISYHCGEGQKQKAKERQQRNRERQVLCKKVHRFRSRTSKPAKTSIKSNDTKLLRHKADDFQRTRIGGRLGDRNIDFKYREVVEKFGQTTTCYLTGRTIKLMEPRSYHFDHIVPVTKGGDNTLENLGLACREANCAKNDMTVNELLGLCKEILTHHGYEIRKRSEVGEDTASKAAAQ
jgi:hypothetical protein